MTTDPIKCPVCGETDPGAAWYCLPRLAGLAKQGEPCSYSIEGHARFVKEARLNLASKGGTTP